MVHEEYMMIADLARYLHRGRDAVHSDYLAEYERLYRVSRYPIDHKFIQRVALESIMDRYARYCAGEEAE